jgi:hypothetical protein
MQINRIIRHPPGRIILPKNKIGRLFVILLHLLPMRLSFLAQIMRRASVARLVRLAGSLETVTPLRGFGAREVAEAIVFCFGGLGGLVVECCGRSISCDVGGLRSSDALAQHTAIPSHLAHFHS